MNRIGTEGPLTFYGSSFISDPYGRTLVQAPRDRAAVLVAGASLVGCASSKKEEKHDASPAATSTDGTTTTDPSAKPAEGSCGGDKTKEHSCGGAKAP